MNELAQRITSKRFQTGGAIYFGALHLVNRAFNMVATYIAVHCTFVKPQKRILGGSCTQGAALRNLGRTATNRVMKGAAHRNLLPVLTSTPKPNADFTPLSGVHVNSNGTLKYAVAKCKLQV